MSWNCVFWLKSDVPLRPGRRAFLVYAVLGLRECDRRCLKVIRRHLLRARAAMARSRRV
jgi:hypothetical protein